IITSSEIEALILEMNLIKQYDPKYNVMLKDDKSYPYLKITSERHPRLLITRKVNKDKGKYFGPYPNVIAARETKRLLDRIIRLENVIIPLEDLVYTIICINVLLVVKHLQLLKPITKLFMT